MKLPVINLTNDSPISVYDDYRFPNLEEVRSGQYEISSRIGVGLHELKTPLELASWSITHSHDVRNELEKRLQGSGEFKLWRRNMPTKTHPMLTTYRNRYNLVDCEKVDEEIKKIGCSLSKGQILYHGGFLSSGTLSRPLSTTFCPEVARNEALWNGKATKIGSVNIYIIYVNNDEIKAYVYDLNEDSHGDEMEVLVATGGLLSIGDVVFTSRCGNLQYKVINAMLS